MSSTERLRTSKDFSLTPEICRAVRIQHAAEGEADRKREEAAAERKRKAEESDKWEKTRDERISGECWWTPSQAPC